MLLVAASISFHLWGPPSDVDPLFFSVFLGPLGPFVKFTPHQVASWSCTTCLRAAVVDRHWSNHWEWKILKQGAILSCWLNRSFNELTKSQALFTASKKKRNLTVFLWKLTLNRTSRNGWGAWFSSFGSVLDGNALQNNSLIQPQITSPSSIFDLPTDPVSVVCNSNLVSEKWVPPVGSLRGPITGFRCFFTAQSCCLNPPFLLVKPRVLAGQFLISGQNSVLLASKSTFFIIFHYFLL